MNEDKRFYTFVFAPTVKSPLRKFNVHHRVIYSVLVFAGVGMLTVVYGMYIIAQHAVVVAKLNLTQLENRRLREQNREATSKFDFLQTRLAALDTTQRKLAETSGVGRSSEIPDINKGIGQGGPNTMSSIDVNNIEAATNALETELRQIKVVYDKSQLKLASTPTGWPVRGYISDGFGSRRNPFGGGGAEMHAGLDIATNHGTTITSTADGIVIFAGSHAGYGNLVVIDHGYGLTTRYAHMSSYDVTVGDHVTRGKKIGAVGSTGRSTAPHCHYEVRLHDRPVDPFNYLSIGRS
jgi:murein DD-endopeptidase MepM/ murein hydrolase activator NlpD